MGPKPANSRRLPVGRDRLLRREEVRGLCRRFSFAPAFAVPSGPTTRRLAQPEAPRNPYAGNGPESWVLGGGGAHQDLGLTDR
jgi:hypothetical protein